jgi:hypothetical protein
MIICEHTKEECHIYGCIFDPCKVMKEADNSENSPVIVFSNDRSKRC